MTSTLTGSSFLSVVKSYIGVPYVYGGESPAGFDCSGLVQYAAAQLGISVPRTSEEQWASLPHVSQSQVQPGDLVFFTGAEGNPSPGHVGIVNSTGNTWSMIDAPYQGVDVQQDTFTIPGQGTMQVVGFARLANVSSGSLSALNDTDSSVAGTIASGALSALGINVSSIADMLERVALIVFGAIILIVGVMKFSDGGKSGKSQVTVEQSASKASGTGQPDSAEPQVTEITGDNETDS